jgi:hypothetical protein
MKQLLYMELQRNIQQKAYELCIAFFLGKKLFKTMLTETRPMDNMKLSFDLPQEDELGTCLLTGGMCSPYMSLYFMRDEQEYRPYQTMRKEYVPAEHVSCWTRAFQYLCMKLQVRNVLEKLKERPAKSSASLPYPGRLLLKSPCHTGRIRHLLQLYPSAQFVYIHRDPIEVFLSSAHMANTTYGYMFLQRPNEGNLKEYILRQGEILVEEYISCVEDGVGGQLKLGKNLVEVSFEDLTKNPYGTIESIYQNLEGMEKVFSEDSASSTSSYPKRLKRYCDNNLKNYERNKFDSSKLDDELLQEIKTRWKIQFERYKYPSPC